MSDKIETLKAAMQAVARERPVSVDTLRVFDDALAAIEARDEEIARLRERLERAYIIRYPETVFAHTEQGWFVRDDTLGSIFDGEDVVFFETFEAAFAAYEAWAGREAVTP